MLRLRRFIAIFLVVAAALSAALYLQRANALTGGFPSSSLLYPGIYGSGDHQEVVPPAETNSHPVHRLFYRAESEFRALKAKQSKTIEDAVKEYRRRYGIPPPPNFDTWFEYAKKRGVQLIDEYDSIHQSLLPFWAVEPSTIRERVRQAIGYENGMIAVLIRDGVVAKVEGGGDLYAWHREATPIMLEQFAQHLPDMDLAFNIHDEPRIVLQHDDLQRHIQVAQNENMPRAAKNSNLRNSFSPRPQDMGNGDRIKEYRTTRFNMFAHQPAWLSSRISCPPDSAARLCLNEPCTDNTTAFATFPLGFIENTTAFSDICNSPSLETSFGFFDRPNAFDVSHELIPVFSQSKVSSFQDILYPSPWYYMGRVKYDASLDFDWDEKVNSMFWRGSTTGGFSRDGGWRRQHRQRFITKIQPVGSTMTLAQGSVTNPNALMWQEVPTLMADLGHYFDVKFTYIGQCDPGDCDAQSEFFEVVPPINMFDALRSKYLLDIDGNAFSGRYYAWLLSNSLVLKLALFREWHDEWLRPWVHYVPLSFKGDEYGELMRYLSEDELGVKIARAIAEQSQQWAQLVTRNEDLEVWYFRLLLEYGRLIDDDRYNIGFSL